MLNKFVTFYVPSTRDVGNTLSEDEQNKIIERVASIFSAAFGGATAIPTTGYYLSNAGKLIREHITLIKSYHEDDVDGETVACTLAANIKKEYGQESIAIETEKGMLFV